MRAAFSAAAAAAAAAAANSRYLRRAALQYPPQLAAPMLIDWNAACSSVEGRPISYSLNLVYTVGFSVVSAFMATSCTAAAMLFMHQRLDETMRAKIWSQFPHFLSSCCVGCIVGAAAWAARTQSIARGEVAV